MLQILTFLDDWLLILLAALLLALLNYAINKKFGERDKVKALNKEVQDYQKQLNAAMKEKDEKKLEELQKIEPQMMGKMKDAMMLPFKAIIITFPIFIFLYWILPQIFPSFAILLPFDIHWQAITSLNIFKTASYGPKGYLIVCLLVWGIVVELVASNWSKIKGGVSK